MIRWLAQVCRSPWKVTGGSRRAAPQAAASGRCCGCSPKVLRHLATAWSRPRTGRRRHRRRKRPLAGRAARVAACRSWRRLPAATARPGGSRAPSAGPARRSGSPPATWIPLERAVEHRAVPRLPRRATWFLASAANTFLEQLYGAPLPELTGPPVVPTLAPLPGGFADEEEERKLSDVNAWVRRAGDAGRRAPLSSYPTRRRGRRSPSSTWLGLKDCSRA